MLLSHSYSLETSPQTLENAQNQRPGETLPLAFYPPVVIPIPMSTLEFALRESRDSTRRFATSCTWSKESTGLYRALRYAGPFVLLKLAVASAETILAPRPAPRRLHQRLLEQSVTFFGSMTTILLSS